MSKEKMENLREDLHEETQCSRYTHMPDREILLFSLLIDRIIKRLICRLNTLNTNFLRSLISTLAFPPTRPPLCTEQPSSTPLTPRALSFLLPLIDAMPSPCDYSTDLLHRFKTSPIFRALCTLLSSQSSNTFFHHPRLNPVF